MLITGVDALWMCCGRNVGGAVTSECEAAVDLLRSAGRVVALTGAGMSQESGVPTFRDALTGLWSRYDPMELATPEAFRRNPARVFGWYLSRWRRVREVDPHAGHRALAQLEGAFDEFVVVTQNVDGMHRRAGSREIIELHGSLEAFRCAGGHPYDIGGIEELAPSEDQEVEPPACDTCGAPIRPDVVWFGESLPPGAVERAWHLVQQSDVVLVIGTSSVVYPAAELPNVALAAGAGVIEINPQETPLTQRATLAWHATAAAALPALADALGVR
jgi:NAD-dependent deacetylase